VPTEGLSPANVCPKFAIVLVLVAGLTFGVYEFGVRRWRFTRLLFGMGPLPAALPSDRTPGLTLRPSSA